MILLTIAYYVYVLLRPFQALIIAYGYVLTGQKVDTPYDWKAI